MAQISNIKYSEVLEARRFDAEFNSKRENIEEQYKSILENNSFSLDSIVNISSPKEIQKDSLILKNLGVNLKLEIIDKNIENKFGSYNLIEIKYENFSKEYLLWWFSKKEVQDYISLFSKGNIIQKVPISEIKKLKINSPTKFDQGLKCVNITLNSEFKEIVKLYYKEYLEIRNSHFFASSFLARAICEAILHQFLLDKKIKKKFLEKKMFGQLLEIIEMNNYNIMNLQEFKNIKKYGNLIHPENANKNISKIEDYKNKIQSDFDKIIRSFGI